MRITHLNSLSIAAALLLCFASCSEDISNDAVNNDAAKVELVDNAAGRVLTPTTSIFVGGPTYYNRAATLPDLKASGFTEVVVWNIAVSATGDLNFNGEFPIASNGAYTGGAKYPDFANDMKALKTGATSINRVTFSVGSSNVGDFQHIRDLVNSQGTGSTSILYRNFKALKDATGADAIDLDDENSYDQPTMIAFCVMLGTLGYNVALDPFTNSNFWTTVASSVNRQRAGTIDQIHLQCYSGGASNNPCLWNFNGIPIHPGLWDADLTPAGVQSKIAGWKSSCGITGGWMWLYDDFVNNGKATQYATAIKNGLGVTATGVRLYQHVNYGGIATSAIPKGNYTLSQLRAYGFVNDWASSMKVPSGWTVTLYQHDNFGGTSWRFTGDNSNFTTTSGLNDQVSSCKIQ
jgi:hypothetical protein